MTLANAEHTRLERCECGTLQLQIGPVQVTMNRRVAQELLEVLAHGMSNLAVQELAEARSYRGLRPVKGPLN
ncbi:MAG: hypothetical protein VX899_22370 [Myxococcota bacterium]|nr:hypothetical protein [Myxococcota bacterium]